MVVPVQTVGWVSLRNDAGVVAALQFKWFEANGTPHMTPDAGDIPEGQTAKVDPGNQGVPDGFGFIVHAHVRGATPDQEDLSQTFIYNKGNQFVANYVLGGTIFSVDLGLIDIVLDLTH